MFGMKKHIKLQAQERDRISSLLAAGWGVRKIARELSRSPSSICEEIKRNRDGGGYYSITAQTKSQLRNTIARKSNPLKDSSIYRYVFDKLRCGWSPEEIAGRLRKEKGKTVICHETIYRYIYSPAGRKRNLVEYLVRKHRHRRKWFSRHQYRRGIQNRVSIHDRGQEINDRSVFGHWEIDSVEGKAHQKGIHTFLERKTRYYQADLINNIDSEAGIKSQLKIFGQLPQEARRSATFDNGKENYNHVDLKVYLKMDTYFCDPYSAWQKGSNEHYNGILRRYLPKKTDLSTLTQTELNSIIEEINHRPAKCLNFATPYEAFSEEMAKITNYSKCSDSN